MNHRPWERENWKGIPIREGRRSDNIIIRVVGAMTVPVDEHQAFVRYLQQLMNRRQLGYLRYGRTRSTQRYMSRLKKELDAYERDGNMEQLLNIATYSFLESFAPENSKFHFDATTDSVTRKEMGGNIA